jgi:NAD(P)-dependent dehydrogenase (short-subunit alcohol dehydrogenase family)
MRLRERVAIVTGAGQGIGRAIALRFAREGARVVVANRTPATGEETVRLIRAAGGEATFIRTDVTLEEGAQEMIQRTVALFGGLDVLCNNAGVGLVRPLTESTLSEWHHVLDTNLTGVFLCSKYAIPVMAERSGGSIINLASVASYVAFPGDAAYCASKGGLLMLTKQMALDYARLKIRVNCICPGFIVTPELDHYLAQQPDPKAARAEVERLHPLGRLGEPDEIAHAAVFLASDESSFVTGSPLIVDGGLLVRA